MRSGLRVDGGKFLLVTAGGHISAKRLLDLGKIGNELTLSNARAPTPSQNPQEQANRSSSMDHARSSIAQNGDIDRFMPGRSRGRADGMKLKTLPQPLVR